MQGVYCMSPVYLIIGVGGSGVARMLILGEGQVLPYGRIGCRSPPPPYGTPYIKEIPRKILWGQSPPWCPQYALA